MGHEMIEKAKELGQVDEDTGKLAYARPEFDVVSLTVITLAGTGSGTDGSNKVSDDFETPDNYDEDPLEDNPWGSRGGGG